MRREVERVETRGGGGSLTHECRQIHLQAREAKTAEQLGVGRAGRARQPGVGEQAGRHVGLRSHRRAAQREGVVARHARCLHPSRCGVEAMFHHYVRGGDPLGLDPAGHVDARLGHAVACGRRHIQRHQELAVAHARLAAQCGAVPRREQHCAGSAGATPAETIGVAGKERAAQCFFRGFFRGLLGGLLRGDVRRVLRGVPRCLPRRGWIGRAGRAREPGQLVGQTSHVWRLLREAIDVTEQVAVGGSTGGGTGPGRWPRAAPALGEQRARRRHVRRARALDEHAGQAHVHGHPLQAPSQRGDDRGVVKPGHRAQAAEQRECGRHGIGRRRFEPVEGLRPRAPRQHVEHGSGQIDAVDVGLACGAQAIVRMPQAAHDARPEPGGPTGSLIRRVERDAFGHQRIEAPVGVVARDLHEAGVDHRRHAGHGERRLGQVRGENHAPGRRGPHGRVLGRAVERSVQRHDLHR